ncbi:MAG: hypothetical protein ABJP45_02580 [Cyclobacteriaceae bacterium]
MKKLIYSSIVASLCLLSCGTDDSGDQTIHQKVRFEFNASTSGGRTASDPQPERILISIEDAAGGVVLTDQSILLTSFGSSFISTSIELPVGEYNLTSFIVIDDQDQVIYVTPTEGSEKAYLVSDPLPLQFSVTEDEVTNVIPEILPIFEESDPVEYGYGFTVFGLSVVELFDLNMAVVLDTDSTLVSAEVLVTGYNSDNQVMLETVFETNETESVPIELLADLEYYTFSVEGNAYHPINYLYNTTELKEELDFPITISSIQETAIVEVSELFLSNSPNPTAIVIYLPLDGCSESIRIDLAGRTINSVALSVDASYGNSSDTIGELSTTLPNGSYQIGSMQSPEDICQTYSNEEDLTIGKVILATYAQRELEFYATWDESASKWLAVEQIIYSTLDEELIFHETYELND